MYDSERLLLTLKKVVAIVGRKVSSGVTPLEQTNCQSWELMDNGLGYTHSIFRLNNNRLFVPNKRYPNNCCCRRIRYTISSLLLCCISVYQQFV